MKKAQFRLSRAASLAAVIFLSPLATRAHAEPAVSAKQALQLAEDALASKNAPGVYLQSLTLVKTSLFTGKMVWTVNWSDNVPGSKPDTKEVGLEIGMDGSVTHLVKGRGPAAKPQPSPH